MNGITRGGLWWSAGLLLLAMPALAETRAAPSVVIGPDEVVHGDLYAGGSTVRVEGTIEGDLVTSAGTVEIPGHVRGDVMAAAGTVRVTGTVEGSLRVLGGQLELPGYVGEDVLAGVGTFTAEPSGAIGRDVMVSAGEVKLRAPVGGSVSLTAGNAVLGGPIAGRAKLTVQSLEVEGPAVIGALEYRSAKTATIAPAASVGPISRIEVDAQRPGAMVFGFLLAWVRGFFAFSLLGLLLAALSPRFARAVPEVLRQTPWHSLGWGALVLLAAPFVTFALFIAGLLLGGWWLGLIAGGLAMTAVAVSFPVVGYRVGQLLVARTSMSSAKRLAALLVGVATVTLALRLPLLGAVVGLGVVLFGLGAIVLAGLQLRKGVEA